METTGLKKFKLGLISLSAFTLLAACGDTTEEMPDTDTTDDATEEVAEDPATSEDSTDQAEDQAATDDAGSIDASAGVLSMDFEISFDDALQTFYDTFGEDVNIESVEFDSDMGEYHYDFQGWDNANEYDLEVSANTGDILDQSTESEDDNDDEDILDIPSYITPEEAMNAAVEVGNSDVVEGWTLEIDDGQPVFEIDFDNADDIDIHAETGEVVNQ